MAAIEGIEFREAEVEDWPAIAALLGRPPGAGRLLRQHLQREHEAWFALVAELAPDAPATGREIAGASGTPIVGAIVAGIQHASSGHHAGSAQETDPDNEGAGTNGAQAIPAAPLHDAAAGDSSRRGGDNHDEATPAAPLHGAAAGEGRIRWLGVAPAYRRRGIASRLLALALDELRYRLVRRVTLLVDGTDVEALALFRKAGFETEQQALVLLLAPEMAAGVAGAPPRPQARATIRALSLDDVPLLGGLLIQLGVERAAEPHDDLEALTPAVLSDWLQRPGTVAYAAWEERDPQTPLGVGWASRRPDDSVLRFVGVQDDARKQGIGRAILGALIEALARPAPRAGAPEHSRYRPLRAALNAPGPEQEFFRRLGFQAEQITYHMGLTL